MTFSRFVGRALLASFFINEGVKAVTKPNDQVEAAAPIADRVVPLAQKVAPASYAGYIPQETKTLVQATGAAQVIGGLAFATGIGRRFGATLLAASMLPHVAAAATAKAETTEEARGNRAKLLRNLSLLGATVLAAQDTEGNPSLGWRAGRVSRQISHDAQKQARSISKDATRLKKQAEKELKKAQKKTQKQISSVVSN